MNSKCGVQSNRKCESHEFCVCIVGFSAFGYQKNSVEYEPECRLYETLLPEKPGKALSRMLSGQNRFRDQTSHSRKQETTGFK